MMTAALSELMFSLLLELVSSLLLSCDVIRLSTFAFIIALFLFGTPGIIKRFFNLYIYAIIQGIIHRNTLFVNYISSQCLLLEYMYIRV